MKQKGNNKYSVLLSQFWTENMRRREKKAKMKWKPSGSHNTIISGAQHIEEGTCCHKPNSGSRRFFLSWQSHPTAGRAQDDQRSFYVSTKPAKSIPGAESEEIIVNFEKITPDLPVEKDQIDATLLLEQSSTAT